MQEMNVGDKCLKMTNVEDVASIKILVVDDVLEVALNENFYECIYYTFKIKLQITKNLN